MISVQPLVTSRKESLYVTACKRQAAMEVTEAGGEAAAATAAAFKGKANPVRKEC